MTENNPKPAPKKLEPVSPPDKTGPAPEVRPAVEPQQQRRYRCYNCQVKGSPKLGYDFLGAADPKQVACPSCGVELATARGEQLIQLVAVIHYEPPAASNRAATFEGANKVRVRGTVGSDRVACDREPVDGNSLSAQYRQLRRTGEPAAVTCPACLGSEVFKAAAGQTALDPRFDLPTTAAAGGRLEFRGMPDDAKITPHDS
jgi:hypothetical protein